MTGIFSHLCTCHGSSLQDAVYDGPEGANQVHEAWNREHPDECDHEHSEVTA